MNRCQVLSNANSGITVGGAAFDITNTIVADNKGASAVNLGAFAVSGPKTFSFNTVAANAGIGVFCATGTNYSIINSVVAGNGTAGVSGCVFTDTCSMGCSSNPMLSTTYHLQSSVSSACVDKVTSGYPADDVDGDTRPQGASADCGADELAR